MAKKSALTIDDIKANMRQLCKEAVADLPTVSVQTLHAAMENEENYTLVDVRSQSEFEQGHLAKALLLPRGSLEFLAPQTLIDPGQKIYVYCRTGTRSALAVRMLKDIGYTNVYNVEKGFKGWAEAGYPIFNSHGMFTLVQNGFEKKEK